MTWEFTDAEGNVIHEATTEDENFIHIVHNLPVTDTLFVSVLLTNDSAFHNGAPVACLIEDYLLGSGHMAQQRRGIWNMDAGRQCGVDVSEPLGIVRIESHWTFTRSLRRTMSCLKGCPSEVDLW